jgi:hypothetical protein
MSLALALLIAAAIWILVLVFALALCRAAKAGDQTVERIPSEAGGGEILHALGDQGAAGGDLIDGAPRPFRSSPIAASRQLPQARARDDDHDPPDRRQKTHDVSAPPGLPTAPANVANRRTSGAGPEPTPTSSPPPTTADSLTPLRALPLGAAAELLGIDPQTLLDWEQEYGYPRSIGGRATGQRYYSRIEVIVVKDALQSTLSIGSAMRTARSLGGERHNTPSDTAQFSSHSDAPPGA